MDHAMRRAVVVTLGDLGRSDDWRDRADAGHSLAGFAEMQEAAGPLLELVLDPQDTFVTRRTAEGLLRRKDRAGLTIVASALAVADDNQADWIHTAIIDVFGISPEGLDEALRLCEEMSGDTDDQIVRGARRLHENLLVIDPFPHPAQRGSDLRCEGADPQRQEP
ncbi:hypothetical protein [Streptomyces sp. NPDC058861]|uniref:hypothetical protein n=1 Tax=Streptomyces sp. NPDC058861 TaxID=3346653 RepID=UPI0036BA835F